MRDGDNRPSAELSALNAPLWVRWKKNQSPGEKKVSKWNGRTICRLTLAALPPACKKQKQATAWRRRHAARWIKIYAFLTLAPPKVTRINCARIRPSGCQHLAMTWTWRPPLVGRACCGCAALGCPCAARAPRIADTWSRQTLQQEMHKKCHYHLCIMSLVSTWWKTQLGLILFLKSYGHSYICSC